MNATALVLASDDSTRAQLIQQLSKTELFEQVKPLGSPPSLLQHLQSQSADIICWAVEDISRQGNWIEKLHMMDQWHDLPVICFAADNDRQSLLDSLQLGASDSVSFSIDNDELGARLKNQLRRWKHLVDLRQSKEKLEKMALTDPLTGLGNRATFDMQIKQASARARRANAPYALMLIDLDHFKWFNDSYGHQAGDEVLQKIALAIQNSARDADICCRYGGEEFAIILPDTEAQNAQVLADRIHKQVAKTARSLRHYRLPITVSIGISSTNQRITTLPAEIIEEADRALYLAKEKGRNRTETWRSTLHLKQVAGSSYAVTTVPQLAFGA